MRIIYSDVRWKHVSRVASRFLELTLYDSTTPISELLFTQMLEDIAITCKSDCIKNSRIKSRMPGNFM